MLNLFSSFFFFFNDTATTEIYTLSLHDALPIFALAPEVSAQLRSKLGDAYANAGRGREDRKSTRLNSSHGSISYAVFCLKKKKKGPSLKNVTTTFRKMRRDVLGWNVQ